MTFYSHGFKEAAKKAEGATPASSFQGTAGAAMAEVARLQAQIDDDSAIDTFAAMMKAKLTHSRAKGKGGWQTCDDEYLLEMLREHVGKDDMRDVALLAMMIHLNRGRRGLTPAS